MLSRSISAILVALEADRINILDSPEHPLDHEVEPEDVHEAQEDEEGRQHAHAVEVENGPPLPAVRLLQNAPDHVHREKPQAEVHPSGKH